MDGLSAFSFYKEIVMEQLFGTKQLYDVVLKLTSPIEVSGRKYQAGEVIAAFDNLQVSDFDEVKKRAAARGGYKNESHVFWEDTVGMNFEFTEGVFSKMQLALMGNSYITNRNAGADCIPMQEKLETDENGIVKLKHEPSCELFVYNADTGEKIQDYTVDGVDIKINQPYQNLVIRYYFLYKTARTRIEVGRQFIYGFLRLEGKMRLKDDQTGQVTTGILTIPKLKIMSDLSMHLGKDANPMVATFSGTGYPAGEKGKKSVCEVILLEKDIDSDL